GRSAQIVPLQWRDMYLANGAVSGWLRHAAAAGVYHLHAISSIEEAAAMSSNPMPNTPITPMHAIEPSAIERPPRALIDALQRIGSATASGELNRLGLKGCTIVG